MIMTTVSTLQAQQTLGQQLSQSLEIAVALSHRPLRSNLKTHLIHRTKTLRLPLLKILLPSLLQAVRMGSQSIIRTWVPHGQLQRPTMFGSRLLVIIPRKPRLPQRLTSTSRSQCQGCVRTITSLVLQPCFLTSLTKFKQILQQRPVKALELQQPARVMLILLPLAL
jgi:hypothetical protein